MSAKAGEVIPGVTFLPSTGAGRRRRCAVGCDETIRNCPHIPPALTERLAISRQVLNRLTPSMQRCVPAGSLGRLLTAKDAERILESMSKGRT